MLLATETSLQPHFFLYVCVFKVGSYYVALSSPKHHCSVYVPQVLELCVNYHY